jgi:hypothetical protein
MHVTPAAARPLQREVSMMDRKSPAKPPGLQREVSQYMTRKTQMKGTLQESSDELEDEISKEKIKSPPPPL